MSQPNAEPSLEPFVMGAPATDAGTSAPIVTEKRRSQDGNSYPKEDFVRFFGGTEEWDKAEKDTNGSTHDSPTSEKSSKVTKHGKLPESPRPGESMENVNRTAAHRDGARGGAVPQAATMSAETAPQSQNSSSEPPDKIRSLEEELQQALQQLEETRKERDSLQLQVSSFSQQSRSFAVAACNFPPQASDAVEGLEVPGDGKILEVEKGENLEVVGRHITGWVRARHAAQFASSRWIERGSSEGWIPEGVLQAVGEVGRGVASRTCAPEDIEDATETMELAVKAGSLLKLLGREGEWWLVEADGCRGFVPFDAVREPTPEEESGMQSLGVRLRRGRSRLPSDSNAEAATGSKKDPENGERRRLIGAIDTPKAGLEKPKFDVSRTTSDARPWTFGLWAYLASYYASTTCILLGIAGILYYARGKDKYPPGLVDFATHWRHLAASIFSLSWGALWLLFNTRSKYASSSGTLPPGTPLRGVIFIAMSAPLISSSITLLAGIATMFVGVLSCVSALRHEVGSRPNIARKSPTRWLKDEMESELKGVARCSFRFCRLWWSIQTYRGERPKWVIIGLWVLANVGLCAYKYYITRQSLLNPDQRTVDTITKYCWAADGGGANDDCLILLDAYQRWVPIAKLFGQGLNLNCGLLLLPVCQHFIRKINSAAIEKKGALGWFCQKLPTHKNLIFHKSLAGVIAVYSFAHTFAHYMAYSYTLTTFNRYGVSGTAVTLSIWATGGAILMCIIVMFPVSREYVKTTNFEVFFYTHVIGASIFMGSLLYHGPIFYIVAGVPLVLYLMDRYFRYEVVRLTSAKLLEMQWRPPVLQLVFDTPFKYHSGQYVWLRCPQITKYEKHPFTIASAPETELLCLAIKCWPGGWTERLRELLSAICAETAMVNSKGFAHAFEDTDWLTGQIHRGVTNFEDGTPLLQIDGPHAAPAMRYLEFEVVILAAAGIGLTPASSILRSLLQYKWKKDPNINPHSIYFAWLVAAAEVPAFAWFADELSDSEVAAAANKAIHGPETDPSRTCELNIFVTRAPAAESADARSPPTGKPAEIHGPLAEELEGIPRPYTGTELLEWMQHPGTRSDKMAEILALPQGQRPNEAGHTCVWNGRPNWSALFNQVKQRHSGKKTRVGVFFCGAPAIGKDLKSQCSEHSCKDIRFRLLKESF